jgi:excisionase family DNA binding protein
MNPPRKKELILYTIDEVAEIMKMSKRAVEGLISSGDLPRVKIGARLVRVREVDLEAFLDANTERVRGHKPSSICKSVKSVVKKTGDG